MPKAGNVKETSILKPPIQAAEDLGASIEDLKNKDSSTLVAALLQKGEFYLLHGDKGGLAYFDMAAKLDPLNSELFLKQGLSLFEFGSHDGNEKGLTLASKCFKKATTLNPTCFEAWHLWGNTLFFLGNRRKEPSYFTNALKKYEKAVSLSDGQPPDILADLFWDLGDVWGKLAEKSGEITDLHYAIKAYEKAVTYQKDFPSEFWIGLGNVTMIMGQKTNDHHFYIRSINAYKSAIATSISFAEGWFMLGKALKALYSISHDEDHFSQSNECFSTAAQLARKDSAIWLEWAHLLLESGTAFDDKKKLCAAVDKCSRAYQCSKKNPYILTTWACALAQLGRVTDRLEHLYEALNTIEPLIGQLHDPEVFYAQGMCYSAFGIYYKDIDYHYQAIETFQEGLSIDRSHGRLWQAIAQSSFDSSLIDNDEKSYERSLHFFERAIDLNKSSTMHSHYALCLLKYGELTHDQATIQLAVSHFEQAIALQKNALYLHPTWMCHYAVALDQLAGFTESDSCYLKALEILNHLLMLCPEFPRIHYRLALTYSHYAELASKSDVFMRAIHHYRIANQKEKENDQIILDWALTLVNLGDLLEHDAGSDQYFREAEYKMIQAAKLGNIHAYYTLACLYSLIGDLKNSFRFLQKARDFGALPVLEDLVEDEWLENLRETEAFSQFISELQPHPQE